MVTLGVVPFGPVTVTFGLGVFGPVMMVTLGVVPLAVIVMLVLRLALIRIVLSAARVAIDGAALVKTLGVDCVRSCTATWVTAWSCEACAVVCVSWALAWVCEETATSWPITWLVCAWAVASWLTALVAAWELVPAVATAATLAWALACSVTVVVVTRLAVPSSLSCCKPSPFGMLVSSASTLPWARRLPPAKATIERVVTPIVTQFFLTLCSLKRTLFSIYINHPFFCCCLYSMIYSDKLQIGKSHLFFINLCQTLPIINFD